MDALADAVQAYGKSKRNPSRYSYALRMTTDALREELQALFIDAAKAAADRVLSLGVPLTRPVIQTHIERDAERNGWQSAARSVERNIIGVQDYPVFRLAPLLTPNLEEQALRCAERLAQSEEVNLPFFSPFTYNHSWLLFGDVHTQEGYSEPFAVV